MEWTALVILLFTCIGLVVSMSFIIAKMLRKLNDEGIDYDYDEDF